MIPSKHGDKARPYRTHLEFLPAENLDLTTQSSRWRIEVANNFLAKLMAMEGADPFNKLSTITPTASPVQNPVMVRTGYMVDVEMAYHRVAITPGGCPQFMAGNIEDYSVMRFRVGNMEPRDNPVEDPWHDFDFASELYPEIFFLVETDENGEYLIRAARKLYPQRGRTSVELSKTAEAFFHLPRPGTAGSGDIELARNSATMSGWGVAYLLVAWENLFKFGNPGNPMRSV